MIDQVQISANILANWQKITVRGTGKAHRAWRRPDGSISIACSCPGSNRGYLKNRTRIVAEGWERSTCKSR